MSFMKLETATMNISSILQEQSEVAGNNQFITDGQTTFTFAETEQLVNRVAHFLQINGLQSGDRVATQMFNSIDFIVMYNAVIRLGAIIVPIGFTLKPREVNEIIADCKPELFITHSSVYQNNKSDLVVHGTVLEISDNELINSGNWTWLPETNDIIEIADVAPDAPLGILYSSGTTGVAKGVLLSHNNIRTNMEAARTCYEITASDRTVLFLPLSHCFGLNAILNCITCAGASMVIMRRFTPAGLLEILKEDTITLFFAVPFIYNLLLKDLADDTVFDKTTYFFSAASKLALETEISWENRFNRPIYQGYGLTETSPFASYVPRGKYYPGSIGIPVKDVQIKITNGEHQVVAPNVLGEIAVKGPNVMLGYYNKPELTNTVIIDNWFYTGDVGMFDEKGLLYIVDRIKDMVIVKGENVYPSEVENVILELEGIDEVAVYGIPDSVSEEKVRARIVLKKGTQLSVEDILLHCKKNLAPFKVPSVIRLVDSLAKSPSGKILKRLMREEDIENRN